MNHPSSRTHSTLRLSAHFAAALACFLVAVTAAGQGAADRVLFGFTPQGSVQQLALEQRFDAALDPADLRTWMKTMSAEANHVGSPHDKANAELVRDLFRQWGWDARIEVFQVLYPTPKSHTLELLGPRKFVASLEEGPIAGDATSTRTDGLPPYNVYGADGDVTAELVYLNYGMPQDYEDLARRGIDVRGKIVITRYGGGWRGLKPKLAQEHGAVGCIIYSDPQDDGYAAGDVYPRGGFRPATSLQRGSVLDMALYPGDPLTPGVGASKNAKRLELKDAKSVLKIPVMPISYGDAQPFLAALGGPVAPARWRGSLPITYHMGPGPAKVHLMISSDWSLKPLYDVIARVPGAQAPDEWVVRGNHRDGWVFGAWDPLSGHVAMLAEAKAIGALLKSGWKPRRTLVYASWDGEEAGLLGSTEWAEEHAVELKSKAVLYLNSDTNARGFLHPEGSHSLQRLVNDVAAGISDPETGVSVQERLRARLQVQGLDKGGDPDRAVDRERNARLAAAGGDLPIGALGSGSDYSAYLQHLGLASLDIEYGGEEDQDGVYHSNFDSFDHYVRFGDPGFAYGVADAKTIGHIVLRMADAPLLPLQFGGFAETLSDYVAQLRKLTDEKRTEGAQVARLIDTHAFALAADPTRVVGPPKREDPVPQVNFAPLEAAVARLKVAATDYDTAYAKFNAGNQQLSAAQLRQLNSQLRSLEQKLTNERGLPGREWFKHFVYAPGLLTGYGVKTLPAVREAIEGGRWSEADEYSAFTARVLDGYCDTLIQAAALLHGA